MSIKAKIELKPRVKLKARRTLEGNLMILDHEDIDIVYVPKTRKCLTFPKESFSDKVYASQDRLFSYFAKKGIVDYSTIRGGNVFGAMEADIFESKVPGVDHEQVFLKVVYDHIQEEQPYFKTSDQYDDERLDSLLRPDDVHSTELGDVPHSDKKGSMDTRAQAFGYQYNYSLVRESESEN